MRQFDQLTKSVDHRRHPVTGVVAVGLPSTVAVHLAPAPFTWAKHNHPGVRLQLFESMSGYIEVRKIVDPVIERFISVCTPGRYFPPREAVEVVRRGIVKVTRDLAARRVWAGIRLPRRQPR